MEVLTYQCPNCGAPLEFNSDTQQWDCKFCLSSFSEEQIKAAEKSSFESTEAPEGAAGEEKGAQTTGEQTKAKSYVCPNCGAQVVTDTVTAATFCVFCGSPTIFPQQLTGEFRPKYIIPFRHKKEDVVRQLHEICKKKKLLPGDFTRDAHIEKVTGVYVPFWLFDCRVSGSLNASAQRIRSWSDSRYYYTETSYYAIAREGTAGFEQVPVDASSKMNDDIMDALEPFDYKDLTEFNMGYLSGYLAEKYDRTGQQVKPRMEERVRRTMQEQLEGTITGYAAQQTNSCHITVDVEKEEYALLPVWVLTTQYRGKNYLFTMNGQTGKIVGRYPLSLGKAALWFGAVSAVASVISMVGGLLL